MASLAISWGAVSGATGYKVYCGQTSGLYTEPSSPVSVGNVTSYSYTVATAGLWYVAISAIVGGTEGALSQEVAIDAGGASPPVGTPVLSVR
jgi:hypothetical protein